MRALRPLEATPEEFRRSGMVARAVELIDVRQPAGAYRMVPREEARGRNSPLAISSSAEYIEKARLLRIAIRVNFLHLPEKTGEALEVEAEYCLDYKLIITPPPKDERQLFFSAFMKLNATLNYWPYFRQYIQEVSSRCGSPKIVLPVLRLPMPQSVKGKVPSKSHAASSRSTKSK